jgi:hypothetical protein
MTTVELRTLKSGDYVKCLTDELENRGLKKGELYRVTQTGVARWEGYNYADIKKSGLDFEIYYKNCHHFEIA